MTEPNVQENSSADEISERYAENFNYRLNHAMVVKFYHPYTQFPRNVLLSHEGIVSSDFFRTS